jgi:hypothetical protein
LYSIEIARRLPKHATADQILTRGCLHQKMTILDLPLELIEVHMRMRIAAKPLLLHGPDVGSLCNVPLT